MPKDQWARANAKSRYGHVRYEKPSKQRKKKSKPSAPLYEVPAGTSCHVRRIKAKEWIEHRTRVAILCHGFSWRNTTHYGFIQGNWEVKVAIGGFRSR